MFACPNCMKRSLCLPARTVVAIHGSLSKSITGTPVCLATSNTASGVPGWLVSIIFLPSKRIRVTGGATLGALFFLLSVMNFAEIGFVIGHHSGLYTVLIFVFVVMSKTVLIAFLKLSAIDCQRFSLMKVQFLPPLARLSTVTVNQKKMSEGHPPSGYGALCWFAIPHMVESPISHTVSFYPVVQSHWKGVAKK